MPPRDIRQLLSRMKGLDSTMLEEMLPAFEESAERARELRAQIPLLAMAGSEGYIQILRMAFKLASETSMKKLPDRSWKEIWNLYKIEGALIAMELRDTPEAETLLHVAAWGKQENPELATEEEKSRKTVRRYSSVESNIEKLLLSIWPTEADKVPSSLSARPNNEEAWRIVLTMASLGIEPISFPTKLMEAWIRDSTKEKMENAQAIPQRQNILSACVKADIAWASPDGPLLTEQWLAKGPELLRLGDTATVRQTMLLQMDDLRLLPERLRQKLPGEGKKGLPTEIRELLLSGSHPLAQRFGLFPKLEPIHCMKALKLDPQEIETAMQDMDHPAMQDARSAWKDAVSRNRRWLKAAHDAPVSRCSKAIRSEIGPWTDLRDKAIAKDEGARLTAIVTELSTGDESNQLPRIERSSWLWEYQMPAEGEAEARRIAQLLAGLCIVAASLRAKLPEIAQKASIAAEAIEKNEIWEYDKTPEEKIHRVVKVFELSPDEADSWIEWMMIKQFAINAERMTYSPNIPEVPDGAISWMFIQLMDQITNLSREMQKLSQNFAHLSSPNIHSKKGNIQAREALAAARWYKGR